jgi:hypothetical protein
MRNALIFAALLLAAPAHARLICANDDQGAVAAWSIGQNGAVFDAISTDGALWCTAAGPELRYIQANFPGLRYRTGVNSRGASQVWWLGEDAAFIIENL